MQEIIIISEIRIQKWKMHTVKAVDSEMVEYNFPELKNAIK